jgi:dTMP kinase
MERLASGLFVVVEGPEGSGKTTQMELLRKALVALGHDVVLTREPGGTEFAEKVRGLLGLGHGGTRETIPFEELLLFYVARSHHVRTLILPSVARGSVVICDRFRETTLAIQIAGHQNAHLTAVEKMLFGGIARVCSDITVVLDVPVEVTLGRLRQRTGERNWIDSEPPEYHERVRASYLSQAAAEPGGIVLVDGNRPTEEVHADVLRAVLGRL